MILKTDLRTKKLILVLPKEAKDWVITKGLNSTIDQDETVMVPFNTKECAESIAAEWEEFNGL